MCLCVCIDLCIRFLSHSSVMSIAITITIIIVVVVVVTANQPIIKKAPWSHHNNLNIHQTVIIITHWILGYQMSTQCIHKIFSILLYNFLSLLHIVFRSLSLSPSLYIKFIGIYTRNKCSNSWHNILINLLTGQINKTAIICA